MQLFLRIYRVAWAFEVAVTAHGGQTYGNLPYFTHLLDVMERIPNPTEDELVAAALHDTVEDTTMTLERIRVQYGQPVADIVELVTKDPSLTYMENIERIIASKNRSAMKVKWADNLANMNADKSHMEPERREKLTKRYAKSFVLLSSALGI